MQSDFRRIQKLCSYYLLEEPDAHYREEIAQLLSAASENNCIELSSRMDGHLKFGTAGVRGKMEAGYNRMNIVSVYRFAFALGQELITNGALNPKVVIAFDGRQNGERFAEEVASVLLRMNINVLVFEHFIPTPLCAFSTKYCAADFGVMITASHNPGYDNGIKLFDKNAMQAHGPILQRLEAGLVEAPQRSHFYNDANYDQSSAYKEPIGKDIIVAYFSAIQSTSLVEKDNFDRQTEFVYTALHGVGQKYFIRALNEAGFTKIHAVEEQAQADGFFPTLTFPNPEEDHALDLAHELAIKKKCNWVFANDPDADRLQVSAIDEDGVFRKLSGNEMGSIMGYFAIKRALEHGIKPLVASSIVSSRMLETIAADLGAQYVDSLTGFSNIAYAAMNAQKATGHDLVFAYEEAIGFLVGQIVLDKDGINASARFAEIAAWLKKNDLSVWKFLDELSCRFGLFANCQWSMRFDGINAQGNMARTMEKIRSISEQDAQQLLGLSSCHKYDLSTMAEGPYREIRANIIIFEIKNNYRFIVRPSGTEPKIKFYLELTQKNHDPQTISEKKLLLEKKLKEQRRIIEGIFV